MLTIAYSDYMWHHTCYMIICDIICDMVAVDTVNSLNNPVAYKFLASRSSLPCNRLFVVLRNLDM